MLEMVQLTATGKVSMWKRLTDWDMRSITEGKALHALSASATAAAPR